MKKIIYIFLISIMFILPLSADDNVNDGIYLQMLKEYTLNEDGSWTYHQAHQLKLLSYFAFNRRYGETFIVFDTLQQNLKVNHCFSTMVDGQKVDSPPNAFNLVLPRYARDAPIFNHLREMVVTHTGIEPGAVINLDYQVETNAGFLPAMMGDEILAADSPIEKLTMRIIIPDSKDLHFQLLNSAVNVTKNVKNGQKIYEWAFDNLRAAHGEALRPSAGDYLPRLVFSAAKDWKTIDKYLRSKIRTGKIDEKIVQKILKDADVDLDKILAVQKIIVKDLAEFPVTLYFSLDKIRSPQQVWQSAGGTALEKAILMAAILNQAGFKAEPVMVSSGKTIAADIPCFLQYDQAFIRVQPAKDKELYLSVHELNQQNLLYTYDGHHTLTLGKETGHNTLSAPAGNSNKLETEINIVLNSDLNITGQMEIELQGAANPYLQIIRKSGKADFLFNGFTPDTSRVSTTNQEKTEAKAELKQKLEFYEQGDYLFYTIPSQSYGVEALHIPTLSVSRTSPLEIAYNAFAEEYEFEIEIPREWSTALPTVDIKRENSVGDIQIEIEVDGTEINIYRSLILTKQNISKADYPDLLELWRLWQEPNYKTIVIKRAE